MRAKVRTFFHSFIAFLAILPRKLAYSNKNGVLCGELNVLSHLFKTKKEYVR